jgi:hypothetical protein
LFPRFPTGAAKVRRKSLGTRPAAKFAAKREKAAKGKRPKGGPVFPNLFFWVFFWLPDLFSGRENIFFIFFSLVSGLVPPNSPGR